LLASDNFVTDMKFRQTFTAFLLALSLGILSGFSPVLHNHDLDLQDDHEDCFSCGWTQVNLETPPPLPDTFNIRLETFDPQVPETTPTADLFTAFLSRAPPTLS
jgi:hypothetical protein